MDVDRRNTARMKAIVEKHGWPTKRMVGYDGMRAAWLLVQHADQDVAFQRECLALMRPLQVSGEVSRQDVAYLTDRVQVNKGKPQVFGTQFHTVEGVRQPRPMHDAANVDKRRKMMGLRTMKEFTELMST